MKMSAALKTTARRVFYTEMRKLAKLSEIHRLFWAVITDRPHVAIVLWKTMKSPLVGALLARYAYSELAKANPLRSTELQAHANEFAGLSTRLLNAYRITDKAVELLQTANPDFGKEWWKTAKHWREVLSISPSSRREDSVRLDRWDHRESREWPQPVWHLFAGFSANDVPTVIDLALATNCFDTLSHPHVQRFLDRIWDKGGAKNKYLVRLFFWLTFIAVYVGVLVQLSNAAKNKETVVLFLTDQSEIKWLECALWVFVFAYLVDEAQQCRRSGVVRYARESANKFDIAIFVIFFLSFALRLQSHHIYAFGFMFLNGPLLMFRTLEMLQILIKPLGILHIVVKRIVLKDVSTWSLYSILVAFGFVVGNSYFIFYQDLFDRSDVDEDFAAVALSMMFAYADPGRVWEPKSDVGSTVYTLHMIYLFIYLMFAAVVMTNLLIALMSATFQTIYANADNEYSFRVRHAVREYYLLQSSVGPPFNLLEPLIGMLRVSMDKLFTQQHAVQSKERPLWSKLKRHTKKIAWSREKRHADRLQVSYDLSQALKMVTSVPMWERQIFDRIESRGAEEEQGGIPGGMMGAEGNPMAAQAATQRGGEIDSTLVNKVDKLQQDMASIRKMQAKQDRDLGSILHHIKGGHGALPAAKWQC
jgi:hypothetical protein